MNQSEISLLDAIRDDDIPNSDESNWTPSGNTNYNVTDDGIDSLPPVVSTSSTTTDPNLILTGCMMGLVAIFSLLLCYLLLPLCFQWVRRKIPATTAQVNRRYETVEGWLITKRVKAHCLVCEELQRRFGSASSSSNSTTIKLMTSLDTAETILHEEEPHQCSICMEEFEPNDLVSWSPSAECEHVFHHACIKTWLLHHECCPYCRVCMLSVDQRNVADVAHISTPSNLSRGVLSLGSRGKKPKRVQHWGNDHLQELAVQRHQRLISTYFCLKEGLVTLHQPLSIKTTLDYDAEANLTSDHTPDSSSSLSTMKRFLVSDVPKNEMMVLRTHPKSIRSTSDVVVTITSPTSQTVGMDSSIDETAMLERDDVDRMVANAVEDIETTMKELPIISNDAIDRNDAV